MIDLTIEGAVAEVVLNAPEKMNAVNEAALAELSAAYDEAAAPGATSPVWCLLRTTPTTTWPVR